MSLSKASDGQDAKRGDKFGVTPAQLDLEDVKEAEEVKHLEEVQKKEKNIISEDYYASPEFKARERRVVRKMDWYIAPLMGSFNFIVSIALYASSKRTP